jgi:hypothetical protein
MSIRSNAYLFYGLWSIVFIVFLLNFYKFGHHEHLQGDSYALSEHFLAFYQQKMFRSILYFPVTSLELSISPKKHFFHFTGEGCLEINIYVRYAHCSWNVFVTWPSLQTREKINVHEQICIYFYMYLFNLFLKLYANSTLRGLESSSSLRNQPLG